MDDHTRSSNGELRHSATPSIPIPPPGPAPFVRAKAGQAYTTDAAGYALVALVAAVVAFVGYRTDPTLMAVGVGVLLLIALLFPIMRQLHKRGSDASATVLTQKVEELSHAIKVLTDHASLSGDARRVINRRGEKELLCRAIEEDIQSEDWDAAIVLCKELADRFGYLQEAEEFRAKIESAREHVQERNVADSIARLDGLIIQRRWDVATREAGRIIRLFPESPRVETLKQRVEQARRVYKEDLERRFLDAAQHEHVEEAMDLLKELDSYLSEQEAEPFREVARGVIGKARENLGAQFKVAVRDKQWPRAAAIGKRIINEFPNTRMANEVRELLDGILARANATQSV